MRVANAGSQTYMLEGRTLNDKAAIPELQYVVNQ